MGKHFSIRGSQTLKPQSEFFFCEESEWSKPAIRKPCCWPSKALGVYQEALADGEFPEERAAETLATAPSAVVGDGYVWPENGKHVSETCAKEERQQRHSFQEEPQDLNTPDIFLEETDLEVDLADL